MFKGIHGILNKASLNKEQVDAKGYTSILKARELLALQKHQHAIHRLPEILNLDKMQFDAHCAVLIDRFAEFVQQLPETQNSYFSKPGGMLDHALHRATLAASLCRAYFLPRDAIDNDLTHQQMLWAYAVFSAGLLYNVGKVAADISVNIIDIQTNREQTWMPWEGAMTEMGDRYQYEFLPLNQDQYRKHATLLLARQLLPHQSFLWLASNSDVLAAWLAILEEDERAGGLIGTLILRADAEIIRGYFAEQLNAYTNDPTMQFEDELNKNDEKQIKDSLADIKKSLDNKISTAEALSTEALLQTGQEFVEWLRAQIEKQEVVANKKESGVVRVHEGVLLTQRIFEKFAAERMQAGNWENVARAVAALGLHTIGENNNQVQSYTNIQQKEASSKLLSLAQHVQQNQNSLVSGLVIKNVNMLFPLTIPPEVHQAFIKVPLALIAPAQGNAIMSVFNEAPSNAVEISPSSVVPGTK